MSTHPAPSDDKFQFSLRSLFVFMLVVCVLLGIAGTPEGFRGITLACYATTGLAIFGVVKRKYWWTVLGLMIAGAIWLTSTSWTFNWRGRVHKVVAVSVIDNDTGQPISEASVMLENTRNGSHVIQHTDGNGKTVVDWEFPASGKDFVLFKTGALRIEWEGLRVKADGYETQLEKIYTRTGRSFPLDGEIPEFEIGLVREKARSVLGTPLLRVSESDEAGQPTDADQIWNRAATENGGRAPREGDQALAAMLRMHSLIKNGGVRHGIESLSPDEIEAAIQGYQYFKVEELASIVSGYEWMGGPTDRNYARFGEDSVLFNHFKAVLESQPELFAPIDRKE